MTESQRLQVRLSECRSKLHELIGVEKRSDEQQAELERLTAEVTKLEPEYRAAVAAEPDPEERTEKPGDPETRERAEIRSRTGVGDFLAAAAGGRAVEGAAAEYAASLGLPTFQRLPLALFPEAEPETRAVTPGPAVEGPVQTHVPYVFERTAAAALGIQMPTHGPGQVQIPRVTTAPPADAVEKDGSAPNTAAAVALDNQTPKRVSGQFEVRVEDLAVYPPLESVLMESIQGSLSNELDEQTFNGANAGGDLNGLFSQAADVAAAGAVETYGTGVARFAALVDGRHAYGLGDVRAVIGPATYAKFMELYQANGDIPLADYLMEKLGAFRVSDRMPDAAGNAQKGIVTLSASGAPIRIHVWSALEVVRDPYTKAREGGVVLTATALVSDVYIPHGQSQVKEIHPKLS